MKKMSYKQKLFTYFFLFFAIFSIIITIVQQKGEKKDRIDVLSATLRSYTGVLGAVIKTDTLFVNPTSIMADDSVVTSLLHLFPPQLRVTIIDIEGNVLYDNSSSKLSFENHIERPEIQGAYINGSAWNIRESATLGADYFYYAKFFDNCFVRVALPYGSDIIRFLQTENMFIYFMILLFCTAMVMLFLLSNHFGKTITALKKFVVAAENSTNGVNSIRFPSSELGRIGEKIVDSYRQIEKSRNDLEKERERLIRHFSYSGEGVCFFSVDRVKIYANTFFMQYLNSIVDEPTFDVSCLFTMPEFSQCVKLLDEHDLNKEYTTTPRYETKLNKNGKTYLLKLLIYDDGNFEIILNDITATEKNKTLKQEMTNNIAHELKTPVSSIRGYVETLLDQQNIDAQKRQYFLERTYTQVLRLSDLIRDVSILTKIEETSEYFQVEELSVKEIVKEVWSDLKDVLVEHKVKVLDSVSNPCNIIGNRSLLYSVFRNLVENSLNYAGENVEIGLDCYAEDTDYFYFVYYDTGIGVDPAYLSKIFDRFYRIDEGRSRKDGGSGLGLSIVKNSVLFHGGSIAAKNRKESGLEYVFSLRKKSE